MIELLNQELARSVLDTSIRLQHFPSLIFAGPAGVGKRTFALLYAQAVNCTGREAQVGGLFTEPDEKIVGHPHSLAPCGECATCRQIARLIHPDVKLVMPLKPESGAAEREHQVDNTMSRATEFALDKPRPVSEAKWQIPIAVIHWLRGEMAHRPVSARRRVVIVLDAEQMNAISANAFLKTLEEPQRDTSFILITERTHKLPDTIRSRCQTVRFSYLRREAIARYLTEHKQVDSIIAQVAAEVSGGSLRRALDYLNQPDDFLLPEAVEFFIRDRITIDDCRRIAEQYDRLPIENLIDSLLFLYAQALQVNVGIDSAYVAQSHQVRHRVKQIQVSAIVPRLETLLRARREFEYNVNRRLFLFALLASMTETGGKR